MEGLCKTYTLGTGQSFPTLRDSLTRALAAPFRRRRPARDSVRALRDVSFEVRRGELVGLIGRNGAGKSTLLKILARITEPTAGRAIVEGRLGSLLEVGTGFHPELTGRENVFLSGAVLGMRKAEIQRRFDEIVDFAELARFIDTPIKRYSTGMYMRLAFSVAAHLQPDILLVDEVLAVGDTAFQRKCLGRMGAAGGEGRTVLFVSHNLAAVSSLCPRTLVFDAGRLVADGATPDSISRYLAGLAGIASDLAERRDRRGDQRLRFVSWWLEESDGHRLLHALSGQALRLALAYHAAPGARLERVHVSIGVRGPQDEPLFYLSTLVSAAVAELPARGVIRCRLPCLPLQPGRYAINLISTVNEELADFVEYAGVLEVGAGPFFASGRLPPPGAGPFLVDHSFEVEPTLPAEQKA